MNDFTNVAAMDDNPFAAPQSANDDNESRHWTEAERTRRALLSHESSVKSIGSTFLMGAMICGIISFLAYNMGPASHPTGVDEQFVVIFSFLALGVFLFVISIAVIRLRQWARTPAMVLSVLFVIAFPIGTFLGPYFVYLLMCQKGATVFSDGYREIISETQHVKYKTPVAGWLAVGILILSLLALSVFTGGR